MIEPEAALRFRSDLHCAAMGIVVAILLTAVLGALAPAPILIVNPEYAVVGDEVDAWVYVALIAIPMAGGVVAGIAWGIAVQGRRPGRGRTTYDVAPFLFHVPMILALFAGAAVSQVVPSVESLPGGVRVFIGGAPVAVASSVIVQLLAAVLVWAALFSVIAMSVRAGEPESRILWMVEERRHKGA